MLSILRIKFTGLTSTVDVQTTVALRGSFLAPPLHLLNEEEEEPQRRRRKKKAQEEEAARRRNVMKQEDEEDEEVGRRRRELIRKKKKRSANAGRERERLRFFFKLRKGIFAFSH